MVRVLSNLAGDITVFGQGVTLQSWQILMIAVLHRKNTIVTSGNGGYKLWAIQGKRNLDTTPGFAFPMR